MIIEYVILLLPVMWALVATLIGIVLYRSSEGFFEHSSGSKGQKRTLRLTGSIVIAAVAFYGMKASTPEQNLLANMPGIVQVSSADLRSIENKVDENINDLLVLESCLELDQSGNCRNQLLRLQSQFRELKSYVRAALGAEGL